jgi:serine phosphatase RsbU (regulator of sigma subunit)
VAGEVGLDIGGDWYDVIPVTDRSVLIAVGDVSGRGVRAASTMAALRFAIHAFATEGDPPATILSKLSRMLSITETGQLATVLVAMANLDTREVAVASAGHLPPLLVANAHGEYINGNVGVPIGVEQDATYPTTTVSVSKGATLLAYTDGLVERKHESLDQGLARLRKVATSNNATLPDLLNRVLTELHHAPAQDDTAIVGLRWTS